MAPFSRFGMFGIASGVIGTSCVVAFSSAAASDGQESFTTTASGLKYLDVKVGTGNCPKKGDTVSLFQYNLFLYCFVGKSALHRMA
jgi:hypothetical protein